MEDPEFNLLSVKYFKFQINNQLQCIYVVSYVVTYVVVDFYVIEILHITEE